MPERDVEVLRVAAGVPAHVLHLHQRVHAREARGRDRRDVAEDVVRDRHLDRLLGRLVAKERPLELQEPGGNCIKIGPTGKLILRDYFLENRSSGRPFLLLRVSFPGRPIFIQFVPGGNCIKIGLPGKLILGDNFQENRTSRRPFL